MFDKSNITCVILAGGEARRMGGADKGLIELAGKPMIDYVIAAMEPQVANIIINANRNLEFYRNYGHKVIADDFKGYNGPLAGMASSMKVIDTELMSTVPCDCPQLANDLAERLLQQLEQDDADISVAHNGKRLQPVFSLLKCTLLDSLLDYLRSGERKIDRWYDQHKMTITDFSDKPESFMNINSLEDIHLIEPGLINA